ncbi:MAG: hypothetical protein ACXWB2_11400, partial [Acidimicrobiales bacterium]
MSVAAPTILRASAPQRTPRAKPVEKRTTIPPLPGLDGLRGVAVAAVLLFHAGFGWARGGF